MTNQSNSVLGWLNRSLSVKMAVVGFLILVLLIPLTFVQSVLDYAYFMPDEFIGSSNLEVKTLKRSIYKSAVYEGSLEAKGKLSQPQFAGKEIRDENIRWDKVSLIIQTTNLKGIKNNVQIKVGDKNLSFSPQYENSQNKTDINHGLHSLESETFDFKELSDKNYSFNMDFNGSKEFKIIPIAKETKFNLKSNWASPSFIGEFLPNNDKDKVTKDGFDADWDILYYNRPFSQEYYDGLPNLSNYAFGVNLIVPVDEYQKSERSAKYGYLVISFTFLFFFLIQAVAKINIHPFQYLLIGLALVLFYTLLISISEHSNFLTAYLSASSSVIALIAWYSASVLKKKKFAGLIAFSLASLYGFIYVIIQLESYALLVGSIGLFVILAVVMYVSRKVDWR